MDESTVDLKELLRILRKRRFFIAIIFLFAVTLAVIISYLTPPTYEAETIIRIKQPKGLASSLLSDLPMGNTMATKQLMSTYAEIIKSRTVLQMVIAQIPQKSEKPLTYEDLLERVAIEPIKDTELLKVSVDAPAREDAKFMANLVVASFIDRMTFLSRVQQTEVRKFIGNRLKDAKKELDTAEADLEEYKRNQKIVSPDDETKALVQQMQIINQLAAENSVNLASAQARLSSAEQQLAGEKQSSVAESPLIQQYKSKLADLEVELVGLLQKYTDKHPDVLALRASIEETRTKLNLEIARVINAEAMSTNPIHQRLLGDKMQSQAEIAATKAQKQAIDTILAQNDQQLAQLPAKEQGLGKVLRDANLTQQIFLMLANRYEEARISEVMEPTDIQIIDEAVAPEKAIKPKKTTNVLIAAFLGLFAGIGLAFMIEYLNKTIRDTEDVNIYLELPVLGSIPNFNQTEKTGVAEFFESLVKSKKSKKGS